MCEGRDVKVVIHCQLQTKLKLRGIIIVRFVIPVVLYEITNVQCVYSSNTTIFIGRI